MNDEDKCISNIISELNNKIKFQEKITNSILQEIKKKNCKKYKLISTPSNNSIYKYCMNKNITGINILKNFITKPTRTISGVSVISVMTSPYPCPHGQCIPCPGGPNSKFKSPQSYMGKEPATMRGFQHNFDPYKQVYSRLNQLFFNGHDVSKSELIVIGGTFSSRPIDYQEWFVKRCIEAMNDFDIKNNKLILWRDKITKIGHTNESKYLLLEDVIKENEKSNVRNVGTTFETRPDCISQSNINDFLKLGCTKIELGVQSLFNDCLTFINRGHSIKETINANKMLKDNGFKVGFHMMLGLHNGDFNKELEEYKILYENENFKPDYLKIYPTLVTEGTKLYKLWKKNIYIPLNNENGVKLITQIKKQLPRWTRLQRIQRDIPAEQIIAGVSKGNIREEAQKLLKIEQYQCKCIRCREIGHKIIQGIDVKNFNLQLKTTEYKACEGIEFFIEIVDINTDTLIGFCRLRFPSKNSI